MVGGANGNFLPRVPTYFRITTALTISLLIFQGSTEIIGINALKAFSLQGNINWPIHLIPMNQSLVTVTGWVKARDTGHGPHAV